MNIQEKLFKLTNSEKELLNKTLTDNLYDRSWCAFNGINYCDPNFSLAREITYRELYEQKV